jgi:hypothetical protein
MGRPVQSSESPLDRASVGYEPLLVGELLGVDQFHGILN